jgi:hypothetical protein
MSTMRSFISFLFVFVCIQAASGQDTTNHQKKHFFIGANYSPDYCYRILKKADENQSQEEWDMQKRQLDSIHSPKYGFTAGIVFCWQLSKKINIEFGIQASVKGYRKKYWQYIYTPGQSTVYQEPAVGDVNYDYFDFPVKVDYLIFDKRFQLLGSIGIIVSKSLQNQVGKLYIPAVSFYRDIYFSTIASIGTRYKLSDRINLQCEPTFRYGTSDIYQYSGVHLTSLGLNVSFFYRIN